jgi:hypothetical protein
VSVTAPGRSWRDRATRGLGLDRWEIAALPALFALSIVDRRQQLTEALFSGELGEREAGELIRDSGAAFLYSDCHGRADIDQLVRPFTDPPLRSGCAAVYPVR